MIAVFSYVCLVEFANNASGANLGAGTAGGAKSRVDHSKALGNVNGFSRTGADDLRSFIRTVAEDGKGGVGRHQRDQIFGTGFYAGSAAVAF